MLTSLSWNAWGPEYVALSGSASCFIALVVLLAHFENAPIFSWRGITLNALVSVLSVTIKASLAYIISECIAQWKWILYARGERPLIDFDRIDSAARGPLGSLRVLIKTKSAYAVQLGAILTLLTLALDPLAQQLVQIREEIVFEYAGRYQDGPRAMISRAPSYSMALSMQGAILNGLSRSPREVSQETLVQCPSSNCTWNRFETLGVCEKCSDLTSDLKPVNGFGMAFNAMENIHRSQVPSTAFTLPNGHFIANIDGCPPYNGYKAACKNKDPSLRFDTKYASTSYGTGNPNKTNSMKDIETFLWSTSFIYPDLEALDRSGWTSGETRVPEFNDSLKIWPEIALKATECALYYCVKNIDAAIEGNLLTENITEMTDAKKRPGSWERGPEMDGIRPEDKMPDDERGSLEFNKKWSVASHSALVLEFPEDTTKSTYTIASDSVKSLSAYVQTLFKANLTDYPEMRKEIEKKLGKDAAGFNGALFGPADDLVMEAQLSALDGLWSWTRPYLARTFSALSTSMTNEMRRNYEVDQDGDSKQNQSLREGKMTFYGKVGSTVVLYHIRWPWIALHGVIMTLTIFFLGITYRSSEPQDGVPLWKNSSLAAIRHGHSMGGLLERAATVQAMEDRARSVYVQVAKGDYKSGTYQQL